jgi:hypothetical protein
MNTSAHPILHPTSLDTLTLPNLHKFSNSFVFDNYNLLIQIVAVLCVGFLLFCKEWENFGVNLHHLVSELHTICLTEIVTNTTWGTTVSSHTVWLKTLNLAIMGGTPQHILFIPFFVCLFYFFVFILFFVFLCYFSVLFFRDNCA